MTTIWVWISLLSYFMLLERCRNVDAECDIEALRCDVICFFPHLIHHCSACGIRRPMRFGKRDPIPSKKDSILHLAERFIDESLAGNPGTDTPNLSKEPSVQPTENPFSWSRNSFGTTSLNGDSVYHRSQLQPSEPSQHNRKGFYDATTVRKLIGKTVRVTNRPFNTRTGPSSPFDKLRNYESIKLSELKGRQFKKNLAFLTSKELNTKELISGIKGVMQMKNLPLDPIDYGCHNYF